MILLFGFMVYEHLFLRYWLGPREDKNEPPSKQDLGSLRLRVCHTEDHVFPSNFYDPLREAILGIKDGQVKKFSFVCFRYLCACTSKFNHSFVKDHAKGKALSKLPSDESHTLCRWCHLALATVLTVRMFGRGALLLKCIFNNSPYLRRVETNFKFCKVIANEELSLEWF